MVKSIPVDSSPRLNNFGSGLYLTCWDFLKEDLLEATIVFFISVPLLRFFIASFIMLIPKVENPTSYKKFQPIGLCTLAYKILSKPIVKIGCLAIYTVLYLLNKRLLSLVAASLKILP